jgi:hypothetical protein
MATGFEGKIASSTAGPVVFARGVKTRLPISISLIVIACPPAAVIPHSYDLNVTI